MVPGSAGQAVGSVAKGKAVIERTGIAVVISAIDESVGGR